MFATAARLTSTTTFRRSVPKFTTLRGFSTTVKEAANASDALKFSGYSEIDFTIDENAMVYEAVQKFAAFNIGCLVTTDAAGKSVCMHSTQYYSRESLLVLVLLLLLLLLVYTHPKLILILSHTLTHTQIGNMTGIVSERDYVCKIALLGRTSKETPVKEIATRGAKIITANLNESVDTCMEKMMSKGIRHLPIVDENDTLVGMISIKDLVATVVKEKDQTIKVLSDFALGRGGHFGSE